MVKIDVLFGESHEAATWQKKVFKDKEACYLWCSKNYRKIMQVNNKCTNGTPIGRSDVMSFIY